MSRLFLILLLTSMIPPVALCGCGSSSSPEGDDDSASDDDDDDATAADDDDATAADDDDRAVLSYEGTAMADGAGGGYAGQEQLVLVDDDGMGAELCRIAYDLTHIGVRDDCSSCLWAYDLEVSNAALLIDSGAGCAAVGHDASTVAAMDGIVVSYGFIFEYVGHADMLMIHDGVTWVGVSFSTYDEASGSFDYGWDEAYVEY
jgi:hypothetical protein